jgi:hypothetical protein
MLLEIAHDNAHKGPLLAGYYIALHFPNGREPSTSHCGDKLNCTKGDIEKHGIIFTGK